VIFTLEALQAGTGDCLILVYGDADAPRFVVIDGGPGGIYDGSLRPRLERLHGQFANPDTGKLDLEMVMVSHIDDDHIHGILDWMDEIGDEAAVDCNIATLWYNSFDDAVGRTSPAVRTHVAAFAEEAVRAGIPEEGTISPLTARVLAASVKQGRELRAHAMARGIVLNGGFAGAGGAPGLVMAPASGRETITRGNGLKLHVIGPNQKNLDKLEQDWAEDVAKNPDPVRVASFVDRSVPNLSSIVVVAEFQGRRMLLTGDARGDFIRDGLASAGFLDSAGRVHFDVIKMPHHGSNRDMRLDWLQKITADHYVISANGQFGNPDADTVEWICQARGDDRYTIHLTNEAMVDPKTGQDVGALVKKALADNPGANRTVDFRKKTGSSVKADVLDPWTR